MARPNSLCSLIAHYGEVNNFLFCRQTWVGGGDLWRCQLATSCTCSPWKEGERSLHRVVSQGSHLVITDDFGGRHMAVTDNSVGCHKFVTDDSGGCHMVVTDNSGGCQEVVTDDSACSHWVVTYDILMTHWSSLGS